MLVSRISYDDLRSYSNDQHDNCVLCVVCVIKRSAGFQLVRRCRYGEEITTTSVHVCTERIR